MVNGKHQLRWIFLLTGGMQSSPRVDLDRPSEIEDGAEVSATISCLAPWDIDDNPADDTMTTHADKRPLVTYESTDIYWSGAVAIIMLIAAYFGGLLNLRRPEPVKKEKALKSKNKFRKSPRKRLKLLQMTLVWTTFLMKSLEKK